MSSEIYITIFPIHLRHYDKATIASNLPDLNKISKRLPYEMLCQPHLHGITIPWRLLLLM